MLKVVICDDDAECRSRLRGLLNRFMEGQGEQADVTEFESGQALLEHFPADTELAFLDIGMELMDGLETARRLRKFNEKVCIVFVSCIYQAALECFKVRAFGFLLKPYTEQDFEMEMTDIWRRIRSERAQYLTLRNGGGIQRLKIQDIIYLEVQDHDIVIHMKQQNVPYYGNMKELERQLLPYGFYRCYTSYLVNLREIRTIHREEAELTNGEKIPISRYRKKAFLETFARFIGEQL